MGDDFYQTQIIARYSSTRSFAVSGGLDRCDNEFIFDIPKTPPNLPLSKGRDKNKKSRDYAVPPSVRLSSLRVGWPTPTGRLWPSLPHTPTPLSSARSLPTIEICCIASIPEPISVAPLTGLVCDPFQSNRLRTWRTRICRR